METSLQVSLRQRYDIRDEIICMCAQRRLAPRTTLLVVDVRLVFEVHVRRRERRYVVDVIVWCGHIGITTLSAFLQSV